MRHPGSWHSLLTLSALLTIRAVPALADDVVVFDVSQQVRIGSLVLQPGTYLFRSSSSRDNRNILTLWSGDEKNFFGCILATYSSRGERNPEDALIYDGTDGGVVKAWKVAGKGSTYSFGSAPVSTVLAGQGKAGSVVAAR